MSSNPFQTKQQEPEYIRQRETEFDLYLRGGESRDPFERWKYKLGYIVSELERGKEIKVCKSLLFLAREMENAGYSFDIELTEEEINKLLEEEKTIPNSINLIDQLDELFYNVASRKTNNGYPNICLAALEQYTNPKTGEEIIIEIAGYWDPKEKLIRRLVFQEYSMNLQTEIRKVYGPEGAFYPLVNQISNILENRYSKLILDIKKIIVAAKNLFTFNKFNEIIDIIDTDKLEDLEKDHYNIEKDSQKVHSLTPQHENPEKSSMIRLTNNPFRAFEVFVNMSVNITDLPKRFLHLDQVVAFGQLGLRFIFFKKEKGKDTKKWFVIKLKSKDKKEKTIDYEPFYLLVSYENILGNLLEKTDVTTKERVELQKVKAKLNATMRQLTSIVYSIATYMLGFKPVRASGSGLDELEFDTYD